MAICDARYWATLVDIGNYGSNNDGHIFINSLKGEKVFSGKMNHPVALNILYFIAGNEAFHKAWFMRPFSGTGIPVEKCILNFRLGILWRVITRDTTSY